MDSLNSEAEFVQIQKLEAEFERCGKQLFNELQKTHDMISDLNRDASRKNEIISNLKKEVKEKSDAFIRDMAIKDERLNMLSLELKKKHAENEELMIDLDKMRAKFDKDSKYYQTLTEDYKMNIERLNDHIKTMNIDTQNLSCKQRQEIERLEFDLNEIKHVLACKENEIKVERTKLGYQIHSLETENHLLSEKVEAFKTEFKSRESSKDEHIQSIMAQSKKIKEQELKMEKDQERHQQQLQRYEIKTKQMNGEIIRLRWFEENFPSIQTHCQQLNNKLQIAERKQIMDKEKLQSLTNQIQTLLEEKEEHLLRLSKIAGANLTLNNPHIADLSDDKRPTKFAEEFSELYDNEWTDAFEVIEVIEEKDKTTYMLLLLQSAYEICHEVSAAHIQNIKNGLCHLTFRRKDVFTKADAKSLKGAGTNTCLEGQNSEELQMKSPEVPGQNNENSESKRLSDDTQYSQQSLTENKVENLSKQRQNINEDFNLDPSQKKTTASESEIEIYHESNAFITNGKNIHTQKTNLESKESDAFDIENFRETRNATDIKNDSKQGNRQKEDKPADQCESLVPPQTESSASVDNGDTPRQEDEETAEIVTETTTQSDSNIILTHSQQSAPFMEMEIINQEPTDLNKDISSHGGTEAEGLANQTISKEILVEGRNEQANTNQMTNTDLLEKEESSGTNGQFDTPTQENAETILDVNMTETSTHTEKMCIQVYEMVFEFDSLQNDQKKTVMELRKFIEINVSDQIESNVANAIAVENRIDVEKDEIITKYIKKCVNICWSMCKHEPPVHIDFNEIQEDKKFDTNVFKPYTKSGKHIDYVIWPALYLHKDGPMLCKGVAQGR